MELSQLCYFLELCKFGSMSKAAESLNISPQGLSAAIRRLESELGVELFFRSSKGMVLTETGKSVKKEAESIIRHQARINEICDAKVRDKVDISVAITTGRFGKLPVSLQTLLITPPEDFRISVENHYSTSCMDSVYNEESLFGLVYGECDSNKFKINLLEREEQVFIVNKKHPLAGADEISIRELDNLPMVIPGPKTIPGKNIVDMFAENGLTLNIALQSLIPRQPVALVSTNEKLVARSLLTDITDEDLEQISILKLKEYDFTMPFSLICKRDRRLTAYEQLFRHLILDCYRKGNDSHL